MNNKKNLKGSWSRDEYKYWRKQVFPGWFTGTDIDFALTSRRRNLTQCFLDYKQPNDKITKDEIIVYDELGEKKKAVYIVRGDLSELKDLEALDEQIIKKAIRIFKNCKVYHYIGKGREKLVSDNYYEWECMVRNYSHKEAIDIVFKEFGKFKKLSTRS